MKIPTLTIPPRHAWPIPGVRPGWAELGGVGKLRRVVFWTSMLGSVGLVVSAETSGTDQRIASDGTRRARDEQPDVARAAPQRKQAGERPAVEKRDEPERHEGTAADASTSA